MTDKEKVEEIRQVLIALRDGILKNDFQAIVAISAIITEPTDLDRQRAEALAAANGWLE